MQKILIEVSHKDQVYVENECTIKGYTLSGFFEKLLNDYREPSPATIDTVVEDAADEIMNELQEDLNMPDVDSDKERVNSEIQKPKVRRKKKP